MNSWYFQVWRIGSVLVHVSQLWCSRTCGVLKNRLRSRTRVATLQLMVHWIFQNVNKTKGNLNESGVFLDAKLWFENGPNRDPVIRDQKSFPAVRNRPLLPRDWSIYSTFRNSFLIRSGNLQFYPFNIRYIDDTKLKIEKFSKSDVGVFWAVAQYGFRNLRFKHRGMQ